MARPVKLHALMTDHSSLEVAIFEEHRAAAKWLDIAPEILKPEK